MLQLSFINAIAQQNAIKWSSAKNRIYAVKDNLLGNFRQNKSFILKIVILALEQTMALRLQVKSFYVYRVVSTIAIVSNSNKYL